MPRIDEAPYTNLRKFADKADEVYAKIKNELESDHWGEFLVIEPDSGDYFLGKDLKEATRKSREKHPDKLMVRLRVGTLAIHRFPGRARPTGFKVRGI